MRCSRSMTCPTAGAWPSCWRRSKPSAAFLPRLAGGIARVARGLAGRLHGHLARCLEGLDRLARGLLGLAGDLARGGLGCLLRFLLLAASLVPGVARRRHRLPLL